jgi:lipid-A-disaccharide synthase
VRIFVSTADASGDLHAAALVDALRQKLGEQGETLEAFGLGGEALARAGLVSVADQRDLAVGGLVEVLSSAPRILRSYAALRRSIRRERPDLVILVDTPDLNIPLAGIARRANLPVFYYIAPQVWAWRLGRIRKLKRRVSQMGVIFPFEAALFNNAGLPATFVGHPLVDLMAAVRARTEPKEVARDLDLDPERPILSLLPGSRRNETSANLEPMIEAARLVRGAHPGLQVLVLLAPTVEADSLSLPSDVVPVAGRTHEAMAISSVLLAAPGTVTVEAALLGIPLVVTHNLHGLTFEIARRVTRVPSSCMVNLIADEGVVAERLQHLARPPALAAELCRLLRDPEARQTQLEGLARAAVRLGGPGASARAASLALELTGRP